MKNISVDEKINKIFILYIIGFLYTLHFTIPVYVNSSFLVGFTTTETVGLIYSGASVISLFFFLIAPYLIERFGNYRMALTLLFIEIIALSGMIVAPSFLAAASAFTISFVTIALLNFNLDVFLESYSTKGLTGRIRGYSLTLANVAWVIAAILTSFILTDGEYWKIYFASVVILIPTLFLLMHHFRTYTDPPYRKLPVLTTVLGMRLNRDIRDIFAANFLMQFYFSWMVIYTPLYLHSTIGFSWPEIGLLFAIMLVPFVLIELPLGKLADTRFGEKEILSIGFIIMALSTTLISFVTVKNFLIWGLILFTTRIGAAMVEIMSETYFFKKISREDVNTMSLFRTMRPLAYFAGPIAANVFFAGSAVMGYPLNLGAMFSVLGILMFAGLGFSLSIKDTR